MLPKKELTWGQKFPTVAVTGQYTQSEMRSMYTDFGGAIQRSDPYEDGDEY